MVIQTETDSEADTQICLQCELNWIVVQVVSIEVLGDDSRHAVDKLLSLMPETIASGTVISSKPKGNWSII
jgi:hypothetical protein